MKTKFELKKREQLSADDQGVFDSATKQLGFVPNMYAMIANSDHALSRYVKAEFAKSSIDTREQEVINLVVSEVNGCPYCLSFHWSYLQKLGFTEDQLMEIRKGGASFDPKLDSLVKFTKALVLSRGHIDGALIDRVIEAGYSSSTIIDTIILINLRGVTNYVYAAIGGFDIDFPPVPDLI